MVKYGEPLTRKALKELFNQVELQKLRESKMFLSGMVLGSMWDDKIHITEILTDEQKEERRILNRGW